MKIKGDITRQRDGETNYQINGVGLLKKTYSIERVGTENEKRKIKH